MGQSKDRTVIYCTTLKRTRGEMVRQVDLASLSLRHQEEETTGQFCVKLIQFPSSK